MRMSSRAQQMRQPNPALVDDLVWTYVCWREASDDVHIAYDMWCAVGVEHPAHRFFAYRAALDREEAAARAYAASLRTVFEDPDWEGNLVVHGHRA